MSASRVCCIAVFVLAAAPLTALAGDWTAWRGPQGTGVSAEKNLPTKWSNTENVKWKVPLDGHGNSTPIVVGKRVLITHSPTGSTARGLRCYDRDSGQLLWKHEVQYDEEQARWVLFAPEASFPTDVELPAARTLEGFDVVTFNAGAGPECRSREAGPTLVRDAELIAEIGEAGERSPGHGQFLLHRAREVAVQAQVLAVVLQAREEPAHHVVVRQDEAAIGDERSRASTSQRGAEPATQPAGVSLLPPECRCEEAQEDSSGGIRR